MGAASCAGMAVSSQVTTAVVGSPVRSAGGFGASVLPVAADCLWSRRTRVVMAECTAAAAAGAPLSVDVDMLLLLLSMALKNQQLCITNASSVVIGSLRDDDVLGAFCPVLVAVVPAFAGALQCLATACQNAGFVVDKVDARVPSTAAPASDCVRAWLDQVSVCSAHAPVASAPPAVTTGTTEAATASVWPALLVQFRANDGVVVQSSAVLALRQTAACSRPPCVEVAVMCPIGIEARVTYPECALPAVLAEKQRLCLLGKQCVDFLIAHFAKASHADVRPAVDTPEMFMGYVMSDVDHIVPAACISLQHALVRVSTVLCAVSEWVQRCRSWNVYTVSRYGHGDSMAIVVYLALFPTNAREKTAAPVFASLRDKVELDMALSVYEYLCHGAP